MIVRLDLSPDDVRRLLDYAADFEAAYPSDAMRMAHQREIYQRVTYKTALAVREFLTDKPQNLSDASIG